MKYLRILMILIIGLPNLLIANSTAVSPSDSTKGNRALKLNYLVGYSKYETGWSEDSLRYSSESQYLSLGNLSFSLIFNTK